MSSLRVYPNPASSLVTIESDAPLQLQLSDLTGRVVRNITVSGNAVISLEDLANGVYYLKASDAGTTQVVKVVKQ